MSCKKYLNDESGRNELEVSTLRLLALKEELKLPGHGYFL